MSDGESKLEKGIPSSRKTGYGLIILPDGRLAASKGRSEYFVSPENIDKEFNLISWDPMNEISFTCVDREGQVLEVSRGSTTVVDGIMGLDIDRIYSNRYAFAAILKGGRVATWGVESVGGSLGLAEKKLEGQVVQYICSTEEAFAALTTRGRVATWGSSYPGGSLAEKKLEGQVVKNIYSTKKAFAALTTRGRVVTWGDARYGGDSSGVQGELKRHEVKQICSNEMAFAALTDTGRVVTWGWADRGGDSSAVQGELEDQIVEKIYSNKNAFAAVTTRGRVVTWGRAEDGGDSSAVQEELEVHVVEKIYSTDFAFAALTEKGKVVTWGVRSFGGTLGKAENELKKQVVKNIYSDDSSFAALTVSGQVVSWPLQRVFNIPNGREVLDIVGNTIILDNWDVLAVNRELPSLLNDPNYLRFIRNRRLYTGAIKRTLLNAADPEKVLEGPIDIYQRAVLGNKDLRELLLTYVNVWRGEPKGEGE